MVHDWKNPSWWYNEIDVPLQTTDTIGQKSSRSQLSPIVYIGGSNIGYLLPLQQQYDSVGVEIGVKTDNYDTIGPDDANITARMVTLYLNHS